MLSKFRRVVYVLCIGGIAVNTLLFATSLFMGLQQLALFNFLSALGCWVGYFSYGENEDGN
jgi:hypothetical protein